MTMTLKRLGVCLLTAAMLFLGMDHTALTANADAGFSESHPNTWENTGDQAVDIVKIALSQVGYKETGNNHTKYNYWYYGKDTSAQWCTIFISWCANQAGIPETVIAKNAWAGDNSFGVPTCDFSSNEPKNGDIVFINNDKDKKPDHVGLVYKVDDDWIYTVEGNAENQCQTLKYSRESGYKKGSKTVSILYYGRPEYTTSSISYSAHVQEIGWQDYVSDGSTAGTTEQSLRMEAVKLFTKGLQGGVKYRVHCSELGWLEYQSDNEVAGTTDQSRAMEAIEIELTGAIKDIYNIEYRCHVQDIGWMDWVRNGETAGTTGKSLRIEAIEVRLVMK